MNKLSDRYILAFDTSNEVIAVGVGRLNGGTTSCIAESDGFSGITEGDGASNVADGDDFSGIAAKKNTCSIELLAQFQLSAHRQSNTRLLTCVDETLTQAGVERENIECVACGTGPGSFTGVRIALATAKGIASALGVALIGVSTLDAVAWNVWSAGVRGSVQVVADAMRREVYPVRYSLDGVGAHRLGPDSVIKAKAFADKLQGEFLGSNGRGDTGGGDSLKITGDALAKYRQDFQVENQSEVQVENCGSVQSKSHGDTQDEKQNDVQNKKRGKIQDKDQVDSQDEKRGKIQDKNSISNFTLEFLPENLWHPTGHGLLLAVESAWQADECDPLDAERHNPAFALPVYTRLSDAEENERRKLANNKLANNNPNKCSQNLDEPRKNSPHITMNDTAINNARGNSLGVAYKPLGAVHTTNVAQLEQQLMKSDAWSATQVTDELTHTNRVWWMALECEPGMPASADASLIGYAGAMAVGDDAQLLKIAVAPEHQRRGIARALLAHVADDVRSLGAKTMSLEVRGSNTKAQAFYISRGFSHVGTRPRYYSDGESAEIMQAEISQLLAPSKGAVGGMHIAHDTAHDNAHGCVNDTAHDNAQGSTQEIEQEIAQEIAHPLIFAIESSCDETAASIVDGNGNILSSVVASQVDFHARFGGVVPEIASRKHIEAICGVCEECFEQANMVLCGFTNFEEPKVEESERLVVSSEPDTHNPRPLTWHDMDAVSATYAPGLLGALVVGVAFAKGAAWGANKPYIGVNHLEGHLYANKIGRPDFAPPALVSLVSGGNTLLVHMKDWGVYETLGYTIDDAVGEAFDKVAKALGLGYPGGPIISKLAATGDANAIEFPRAMLHSGDYRFSLSGLKTAVVTYINNERNAKCELNIPNICASFTAAVVDVQVAKAKRALEETGVREFCLGGGVAANPTLRDAYEQMCDSVGVRLTMPPLSACGDNAAMIVLVALDRYKQGKFFPLTSDAQAHVNLDEPY